LSINWHLDVEPAPAILVLPPAAESLDEANAAIELWEHYSGKKLDPTQRLTVQVMMAQKSDGTWAAATTGREMPRQNGKGDEVEVPELWGLVQRSEAILHTVHDAVLLASQAQQRMLAILENHADLRRLVKRKWQGTGQQMIEMRNGGVIWYRTRTGGGGRGVDDIDRLVVDEAQHATEEHLAAVAPTLLANPNPQMNVLGTAAIAGKSDWWWSVRRRALEDDPGAFGYVGHTAEKVELDDDGRIIQNSVDVHDRTLWQVSNPALTSGRGQGIDFLEEQLRRLGEESFLREHMGVWDPPEDFRGSDLDVSAWVQLEDIEQDRPNPVAFSVEVSADRKWTSIGLAGLRSDDNRHLQIVQVARGTGWAPQRLAELVEEWEPVGVILNPAGPAGALLAKIEALGVDVTKASTRDYAQSCGLFMDGVTEGTIRHMGQAQLNRSVSVARKRGTGDAFLFESSDPGTDISPLRAVTLALLALESGLTNKPKRSGRAAFY
jgi:hypothetical protein